MAEKHPGGRPKGSKNKRKGPAQVRISQRKIQPCPDLRKAGHGADCAQCGGSGEITR